MRKEVIVCDECGEIVKEKEVKRYMFEHWWFELCEKCCEKKEGLKEEYDNLYMDYDKKRKALLKKYSLDKLINR